MKAALRNSKTSLASLPFRLVLQYRKLTLVQLSEAGIGQWSAKFKIPGDEPLANWWLITVCSAPCYTPALYGDTEYVFFFPGLTDEDFNPSDASAPFLFSVISSYLLFG